MTDLQNELRTAVLDTLHNRSMSQAELARKSGLSTKHISQLMTGKANGRLATWQRIFRALGMQLTVTVHDQVDGSRVYG